MEKLTSTQNPRIKHVLLLQQKAQERRKTGLFVLEGQRELERATARGYQIQTLFVCPEIASEGYRPPQCACPFETIEVTPQVYSRMAYREGTEGTIAIMQQQQRTLSNLTWQGNPLFVVLEGIEKPGNVGAILRSADAAGVTAVLVCDPQCDLYNPNLLRSSLGSAFTVPNVACGSEECITFLKQNKAQILTAQLQDSHLYYDTDMTSATAIVMGTEATGLTNSWRQAADAHIRIPMLGGMDSLNVSVSAAILMFEAVRQRQSK